MEKKLYRLEEVVSKIKLGRTLVIAADDSLLKQLPEGNWIGGSNPYLLDSDGGKYTEELIHIQDFTDIAEESMFRFYDSDSIKNITKESYANGIIFAVVPGFSDIHYQFSLAIPNLKNLFVNPLMGWISGSKFDEIAPGVPSVYIGGKQSKDKVAVLHLKLPANKVARIEIINVYEQGDGDEITFSDDGFLQTNCFVNGVETNLYKYLERVNFKWYLPLMADYSGAKVNVGLIKDEENKRVLFAAPVFKDVVYKIAKDSINDYNFSFFEHLKHDKPDNIIYSYSCLYNYFNFSLEGKTIPGFTTTFTFGEIAYQLLNITFVYLVIDDC